jgi:hypothetical protein
MTHLSQNPFDPADAAAVQPQRTEVLTVASSAVDKAL